MTTARYNRVTFAEVATFATTAPSSLNDMTHLPAIDPGPPNFVQNFDEGNETSNDGSMSVMYPTAKDSSWELQTRIYTGDKPNTGGTGNATTCFAQKLLNSYFNMDVNATGLGGAGTTVASGTDTIPVLTSGTGVDVGEALMFGGSGTNGEIRFVTTDGGASVTLDTALATAANYAAAAVVYSAFNFKPTMGAYAPHVYLSWEAGSTPHERLLGPGKITSLKLAGTAAREGCRYVFGFEGDTYAAGITSGTFTVNAFTGSPLVSVGATVAINGTDTPVGDFEIDFGVKHEPITATSGTNGRTGWEVTECMPSGSFTEYYTSEGRWTQYAAATSMPIRFSIPVSASGHAARAEGSLAVFLPNCNIKVEEAVLNGQRANKISFQGKRPTAAQIATGITSPVYLAVFGGT